MKNHINQNPKIIKHICKDDGIFPNSSLFVLVYKQALNVPDKHGSNFIKDIFKENDWKNSWKNGIYDYHHYHSTTHEVLGIYSGSAVVQFGGPAGIAEQVETGDVIIIPAGVSHKCISGNEDFKCVGAYPDGKDYDILKGEKGERPKADQNIKKVPLPEKDPVYGAGGLLMLQWEVW